jgi:hypothetical protein
MIIFGINGAKRRVFLPLLIGHDAGAHGCVAKSLQKKHPRFFNFPRACVPSLSWQAITPISYEKENGATNGVSSHRFPQHILSSPDCGLPLGDWCPYLIAVMLATVTCSGSVTSTEVLSACGAKSFVEFQTGGLNNK